MSRIPLAEPESVSPAVNAIYDDLKQWGVPLLNVMKMFGNHEGFLRGFYEVRRSHRSPREIGRVGS